MGLSIRRSSVAGHGLFTQKKIRRGQKILRLSGQRVEGAYHHDDIIEDPMMVGVDLGVWLKPSPRHPERWLNHSCNPNAILGAHAEFFALRDIASGEEIVFDYSTSEADPWWTMTCHCGAANCRHTIRAFQYLPKKLKRRYRPLVAPWLRNVEQLYDSVPTAIADAALLVRQGTPVAFPTESFFGLAVRADDESAIRHLFQIKQREAGKPIALIAADLQQVKKFFVMSKAEVQLARKHWPGPLTILLKPKATIQAKALGAQKIGVRVPAHAVARRLAARAAAPITATSANISGQPPTKSARQLKHDFPDILIVPGRCGRQSKPSTIIDVRQSTIHVIRQGSIHPVRSLD
jgi:L-threonylcarbamoyladenylate synthase